MVPYKLISLDIWGTLLAGNPAFSRARNELFAELLQQTDIEAVTAAKNKIDREDDELAIATGHDYGFAVRMEALARELGMDGIGLSTRQLAEAEELLAQLCERHPPLLIEPDLAETLRRLRAMGLRVALLSNTGLLSGKTMRRVLDVLGLRNAVDFILFSDEVGVSKPYPGAYQALLREADVRPEDVLHVGDSLAADYDGAWRNGIDVLFYDRRRKHAGRFTEVRDIRDLPAFIAAGARPMHRSVVSLSRLGIHAGRPVAVGGNRFDAIEYSRFKYGLESVGHAYGRDLAEACVTAYGAKALAERGAVIVTSPCKAVPKASNVIVRGFRDALNRRLHAAGLEPAMEVPILKDTMFEGDYATFSDEQRRDNMRRSAFHAPETLLRGKTAFVIDDVRITGAHESRMAAFLAAAGVREAVFLYVGDLDSASAAAHPDIENVLNHSWMNGIDRLCPLMASRDFVLNVRVCKYVLSRKNAADVSLILAALGDRILLELYGGILADGYAGMGEYVDSFALIEAEVERRRLC